MRRWLERFVVLFGVVCCGIGLTHIVFGPRSIPGSVPVNATMDSEDRFYATLFVGFGGALIWCARALDARAGVFRALMAVFFASGVSRIISAIAVGPPGALFIVLGGLELALPPLLLLWLRETRA